MTSAFKTVISQEESLARHRLPSGISTLIIAAFLVTLRFASRRLSKAGLWWDDWIQVPATAFGALTSIAIAIPIQRSDITEDDLLLAEANSSITKATFNQLYIKAITSFRLGSFIEELGWCLAIACVKYSIIAFYWRLFGSRNRARWCLLVLVMVTTGWTLATMFLTIFQCNPVSDFWQVTSIDEPPSTCKALYILFGTTLAHVLIDITLLLLPIPWIWRASRMNKPDRIRTLMVFGLGSLAIACSIVRFCYICVGDFGNPKPLAALKLSVREDIWTGVEVNVSIMSSCLPTLRPILAFVKQQFHALKRHMDGQKRGEDLLMDIVSSPKDLEGSASKDVAAEEASKPPTYDDVKKAGLDIEQQHAGVAMIQEPGELHGEETPMPELASVHVVSELPATESAAKRWSKRGG